jgi:hypothetical protein
MQRSYNADPDSFEGRLLKKMDYKDREGDHSDGVETLYMMDVEEYLDAKKMKPGKQ